MSMNYSESKWAEKELARGGGRSRQTFTLFSMFVATFFAATALAVIPFATREMPSFSLNEALMN